MASVLDVKSKEEKDAELDRKIEALRKKNEALVRRHQMIEEDRKRAEQEGIAVTTPRKAKHPDGEPDKARKEKENFSITLDVSAGEKRVVNDGKSPKALRTSPRSETSPRSPTHRTSGRTGLFSGGRSPQEDKHGEPFKGEDDDSHPSERAGRGRRNQVADMSKRSPRIPNDDSHGERWSPSPRGAERGGRGPGRGGGMVSRGGGHGGPVDGGLGPDRKNKEWEEKRKQNIEKMNEEMEKIAEYERSQRDGVREKNPIRNFLDDPRRTGPIAVEVDRKEGSRRHIRNWGGPDFEKVKTGMDREKESHGRRPGGRNQMDMTMSMTGKERAEYVRWKQERDQIDQERLARHRKPTGQWRREWDAEKNDSMFKEGGTPHVEEEPISRRDQGKRGAPKPPTMAEFLPENLKRSTQRRNQNRGRSGNKPYSMHDSRWEDDDDDVGNENNKPLPSEEKEKETCVEKAEIKKAEEPQKQTSRQVSAAVPDKKKNEGKHENVEDCIDDEEEWTDASGDVDEEDFEEEEEEEEEEDSLEAEEDSNKDLKRAPQVNNPPATPKEQRLPKQVETPKLTMPPPDMSIEERAVESKPTSPFSPEGHRPVTDWGEEMELLSPPGSSNEDSPPQAVNTKGFNEDTKSQESFSPSGSTQNQNPTLDPVKNLTPVLESESVHSTETKTNLQQTSPEWVPEGNVESCASQGSTQNQSPALDLVKNLTPVLESESVHSTETKTNLKQTSPGGLPEGNVESCASQEETLLAAGETTPVEEGTSLSQEGSSLPEAVTLPAEEVFPQGEEVSSPAEDASSPAEEVSSPAEEVSSPAEEVSSPAEEVSSPAEEVSSPAEEVSSPAEEVSSPAEEMSSPAEEVSYPAEEVSSPDHAVSSPAHVVSSPTDAVSSSAEEVSSPADVVSSPALALSSPPLALSSQAEEVSFPAEAVTTLSTEGTSPAVKETSPVADETSPTPENSLPVSNEAQKITQETSPSVEMLEGAAKSVHIADFETQSTEVPPLS